MITNREYEAEIERHSAIYSAQTHQLERAYAQKDPVSWRKHPLSPLTPLFLSHVMVNANNIEQRTRYPSILDLGCGAGEKTDKFRYFSLNVVGVDSLSQVLVDAQCLVGREVLGTTMNFVRADIKNLPFVEESFDGAHDYLSFLHIMKEDWYQYIESVHRVLKPGAPLLLVTFSGNDPDFYGYPINRLEDRAVQFSDQFYAEDKRRVAHLVDSYFYFPLEYEIKDAFKDHFELLDMKEIHHPMYQSSEDHKDRKLWHVLLRKN